MRKFSSLCCVIFVSIALWNCAEHDSLPPESVTSNQNSPRPITKGEPLVALDYAMPATQGEGSTRSSERDSTEASGNRINPSWAITHFSIIGGKLFEQALNGGSGKPFLIEGGWADTDVTTTNLDNFFGIWNDEMWTIKKADGGSSRFGNEEWRSSTGMATLANTVYVINGGWLVKLNADGSKSYPKPGSSIDFSYNTHLVPQKNVLFALNSGKLWKVQPGNNSWQMPNYTLGHVTLMTSTEVTGEQWLYAIKDGGLFWIDINTGASGWMRVTDPAGNTILFPNAHAMIDDGKNIVVYANGNIWEVYPSVQDYIPASDSYPAVKKATYSGVATAAASF